MRSPSAPDLGKSAPVAPAAGARDPSYPDRARIDSDVRYLLRPPSTPWITFDKDEPHVGALLASSRSSVHPEAGFFPETPAAAPVPSAEPSNVVVTSDIQDSTAAVTAPADPADRFDETHDSVAIPVASPRRIGVAVACALGLSALIAGTAWSFHGRGADVAAASSEAARVAAAPVVAEPAPPQLDLPAPPPTAAAESAPPAASEAKKAEDRGFGRLYVRGAAKHNRVYFDGKLLLGRGQRSFMVFCGPHTIAVGNKADARDVEVPCNGALVVSK